MAHLSDHDLRQFDDAYLETLTLEQARALLGLWRSRGHACGPPPDEGSRRASRPRPRVAAPTGAHWGGARGRRGTAATQALPVDVERAHAPTCCAGCGRALTDAHPSRAHNVRHELDLIQPAAGGAGLVLQQTKHLP